eukprot:7713145-Heterocapsa_arctica.AAC.1
MLKLGYHSIPSQSFPTAEAEAEPLQRKGRDVEARDLRARTSEAIKDQETNRVKMSKLKKPTEFN